MQYITKSILKLPPRRKETKKGDYGRVLVIGGSEAYVGAPAFAAQAALAILRSGVDLVTVAAPEKVAWAINKLAPDIITIKIKGKHFTKKHISPMLKLSERYDVTLIGCGLSMKAAAFASAFIRHAKKPLVIDADALKVIRLQDVHNAILTPHRGEYAIFMKHSKLPSLTTKTAFNEVRKHLGTNVILLKAPIDVIMSKDKIVFNKVHNPVMAKGGTGDVLAGLCAGFLAQTRDPFRAACMAAYLNGAVGNYLLKKRGRTFAASDIVDNIYKVFR
ncbi:NAD(P)H-hydrate dehydratase [Candidatus Woesearchaeota archaeon]|nr:NAD(P)H-hydrate dehydratase [Candidatus Woesearchaeota archaeon]